MAKAWFKTWGWIYRPVSWPGAIITFLFILFLINVFLAVDKQSHSVSDTLYGIFPFWLPSFLAWLWIADKTRK